LSLACNHRPDGATNGESTTAGADGRDYHDGVLFCDYVIDQCSEGEDFPPYCMDLYP